MNSALCGPGRDRRRLGAALLLGHALAPLAPLVLLLPSEARAGRQVEEPLADSVRSALSASVVDSSLPPALPFRDVDEKLAYLRWLAQMSTRLQKRESDYGTRIRFLETLRYAAMRKGLEPSLVLGLVQVESGFRRYAISRVGARGYMQVMPFWARLIGDGNIAHLFHMQTNLAFGCVILRHYLDLERGDMYLALGRYNGSRGQPEYPGAVFASQRSWTYLL